MSFALLAATIKLVPTGVKLATAGVTAVFGAEVAAPGSTTSNYIATGGATIAISALAYVAKQFAGGNLVSRSAAHIEAELARLVQEGQDNEKAYIDLVKGLRDENAQRLQEMNEIRRELYGALAHSRKENHQ
jgi:hypothetical protein